MEKELAAPARPRPQPPPKANVVQMRVKDLLRLNGQMSTAQIIETLAGGGLPGNSMRSAIGILDWHQHITTGRDGWEPIDDDDELARQRHWRAPFSRSHQGCASEIDARSSTWPENRRGAPDREVQGVFHLGSTDAWAGARPA